MRQHDIIDFLSILQEYKDSAIGSDHIEAVHTFFQGLNLGLRWAGVEKTPEWYDVYQKAGVILGFDAGYARNPMAQLLNQGLSHELIIERLFDLEVYLWTHGAYTIPAPLNQTPSRWAERMRSTPPAPHADTDSG